jgi:hypothetical protein
MPSYVARPRPAVVDRPLAGRVAVLVLLLVVLLSVALAAVVANGLMRADALARGDTAAVDLTWTD